MKYLKMLGLAIVAAAALMAVVGAGTASAKEGVLCSTASDPCNSKWAVGTVLDFSNTEPATLRDTSGNILDSCTGSTVKGKLTANPDATGTATGENTELTWTGCTVTTDTILPGKLKVEAEDANGNGNVYADAKIEVTVNVFSSCNYGVEPGAKIGTISEGKDATSAGPHSHFTAIKTVAKKLNGGFLCPETTTWNGTYVLTSPVGTTLWVSHK